MRQLEMMVELMVACAREPGSVSMGVMRAQLIREGMDSEELTLLMEIVALEVRSNPPSVSMACASYKRTLQPPTQHIIDVVV